MEERGGWRRGSMEEGEGGGGGLRAILELHANLSIH